MDSLLSQYYFSAGEVAAMLLLIAAVLAAASWAWARHWRRRLEALKTEVADSRSRFDTVYARALHDHLQTAVAHEFIKGLDDISSQGAATLDALGEEEHVLRGKQQAILGRTYELEHRAKNLLAMLAPEQQPPQRELLSVRRVVEHVLQGLYRYADSEGVTLVPELQDVEPAVLGRDATSLILENLVHNAIKYSLPGGTVRIRLSLQEGGDHGGMREIYVDVIDAGRGIPEGEQGRIFQLHQRGDGLLEPGTGLGLYLAREAARCQGGDVVLVRSRPNEGATFRVTFPASDLDLGP